MERNTYELRRMRDTSSLRHGGRRTYRHFKLIVNGRKFTTFADDNPMTQYYTGTRLDEYMRREITHLREFFPR